MTVYDKEKRTIVPEPSHSNAEPVAADLDRIAMALHDEWNGVGGWASITDSERKRWRYMAKVALAQSGAATNH